MAYLVLDSPDTPTSLRDTRMLAFESLDGSEFFLSQGRDWFFQRGLDGLGTPPREIVTRQIPGMDGAKIREIRTGVREIFMPLFLENGSSHEAYLDDLDALEALFAYDGVDYQGQDGTFNVVAISARGNRRLRCTYQSGMDTGYGTDAEGNNWASIGFKFLCVQPYWYGDAWESPTVTTPEGVDFFEAFPPALSSSYAFGPSVPVEVLGRKPSWATIDLTGPADSVTISAPGLYVTIPDGVAAGETVVINTRPGARTAQFAGVNDWSRIGPVLTMAPLDPGEQALSISMPGATSTTTAKVSGMSLWERPW